MTIETRKQILYEFAQQMAETRDRWQKRLDEIEQRYANDEVSGETHDYVTKVFAGCRDACDDEYVKTMEYINNLNRPGKPWWKRWLGK